jgi:HEAT repeat protein
MNSGALKSSMAGLVLLASLASGCSEKQETVPLSKIAQGTGHTERVESASVMDSGTKVDEQGSGDHSNVVEQPLSANSSTQAEALTAEPLPGAIPVQNLDFRLQDVLRNFHATGDRLQRSALAVAMVKLADDGVPKSQIASGLGYLFQDENSVEVKTDILNELGNLEDPSAYNQIVAGLDRSQPDEIHAAAIEELGFSGDKRAIPLIQPFLADRDQDVRSAAQLAIDSLNQP